MGEGNSKSQRMEDGRDHAPFLSLFLESINGQKV